MLGAKVLALCWNSNGIKICDTLSSTIEEERRKGVKKYVTRECDFADFLPELKSLINEASPDIVCIGFEQESNTGTYFHSKLLPHVMESDLPYKQIYRDTMTGGSISSSGSGALRMSIYGKGGWGKSTLKKTYECSSLKDGTGGMSCVLDLNGQDLVVINAYVAFDKDSVKEARTAIGNGPKDSSVVGDPIIRQDALNYANICYNGIIRNLVLKLKNKPDYVILMGDLNYRTNEVGGAFADTIANMFSKLSATEMPRAAQDYYKKYDELHQQIDRHNIYQYEEGVSDTGPGFAPVCVMKKGRDCKSNPECWDTKLEYIGPSWCNRILFKNYINNDKMCCLKYNSFDEGDTMKKSKNKAVYALFQIGRCPPNLPPRT